MSKPRDERQKDLFRPALDQIIDLGHPLVRLAQEIDWDFPSASARQRRCRAFRESHLPTAPDRQSLKTARRSLAVDQA
jgi:hypothetical protein